MGVLTHEGQPVTRSYNRIVQGDCLRELKGIREGSIDLAFADPPYNIGYQYDEYDDKKPSHEYLRWSKEWMTQVIRVLKPNGTFWLAIGDEYAAELKLLATRELGLICRNWVVWYYTFGVHCANKLSRSHAHLFYFVRNPKHFTFNDIAIRVPSARQLVYADKRANPQGRVPDDTWIIRPTPKDSWILRPQDLPDGFVADGDTWYFPRVCGTFKERGGFHGCQLPEQLLGRIILACSNDGDRVLDPFVGSGTTVAVAKKLNRRYLGCDISKSYVEQTRRRLSLIKTGDPLDGAENPLTSVANTRDALERRLVRAEVAYGSSPDARGDLARPRGVSHCAHSPRKSRRRMIRGLNEMHRGILEAFERSHRGHSSDRVIADPRLNADFLAMCQRAAVPGTPLEWNATLLKLRKSNRLSLRKPTSRTKLDTAKLARCEFASEIAFGQMRKKHGCSLDQLLCDPALAEAFDLIARQIAPGLDALYYRWAALGLRKRAKLSRDSAVNVADQIRSRIFSSARIWQQLDDRKVANLPGLYLLGHGNDALYVGETGNLQEWLTTCKTTGSLNVMENWIEGDMLLSFLHTEQFQLLQRRGAQSYFVAKRRPQWNYPELAAKAA